MTHAGSQPLISAQAIEKFYDTPDGGRIQVIAPLDLTVQEGEIVALLGPSGSGKSTLLRMLSGLSKPSAGKVYWSGNPENPGNLAIVFQSFALFPWLTVQENVEAPLEARAIPPSDREERSLAALETVGLAGYEGAYPKELSGGMKQRVGFARALVVEPEVLFMDEPFSALDVLTAENLRTQVIELWGDKKLPTRAIFIVTHNIEEAVLLADRIIVLGKNPGRIRTDFHVTLPQPRDRKEPAFERYVDYIYKVLTQPALDPAQFEPSADGKPARRKQQMLPHALPGGIAGLLEILFDDEAQTVDIYRLADDLALELDDILPTLEAAQLLGFVLVSEGDVTITELGKQFADGGITEKQEIFGLAAVDHVNLLNQITRALNAKKNHSVREEFFRDMLDEYFSSEEIDRQMDTAINWGRYAGLFEYDADERKFYLPEPDEPEAEPAAKAEAE